MAICSLIPVVGAALVWVPTALWLLLSGAIGRGVILDCRRRPRHQHGGQHPEAAAPERADRRRAVSSIFLGLLGGVSAFGFIGLVLGPIILVTAGSLLKVFTQRDAID